MKEIVYQISCKQNLNSLFERTLAKKLYEGTNHLGNVLVVFTDVKIPRDDNNDLTVDYFQPFVLSSQDYSPFGVQLSGRKFESEKFRYGFNGMEKDDELKGAGNSYDFGARMLDSRLGRWLSIDRLTKAQYSPYVSFRDCPLLFYDSGGDDDIFSSTGDFLFSTKSGNKIRVADAEITKKYLIENQDEILNKTKLIADFTYHPEDTENNKMLRNVMLYYFKQSNITITGKKKLILTSKYGGENEMASYTKSENKIRVAVNKDGKIAEALNVIGNFKNTLVHEGKHQTDPNPTVLSHVTYVIFGQMDHSSWNETSEDYKNGT